MVRIGSNIFSLNAQRRLAESTNLLSDTFERLSSGQRINKASDDAAGLSIVSSLNTDKRVFSQGIRNLNDGVSALTIAEGALEALSSIVIRLQELAEQSANGVYGTEQRQALDQEAQELSKEYFRISKTTEFNGLNLLDGTMDELRLQAGYGLDGGIASGVGGAGSFENEVAVTGGFSSQMTALSDLNGDGLPDLIMAHETADSLGIHLNTGNGSFGAKVSYGAGDGPVDLAIGDINGDGVLDIATAEENSGTVSVFIGKGNGSFNDRISTAVLGASSLALGDLNNDGILDMVTLDYQHSNVGVLIGKGNGTFDSQPTFNTSDKPRMVKLEDLNGDGALDIVTDVITDNALNLFMGNGDGTFASHITFGTLGTPNSFTVGDLNNDQIADIVVTNTSNTQVKIYIGNGDGSFQNTVSYDLGEVYKEPQLGDLNGDGVLDLVIAGSKNSSVSVLMGLGDGRFSDPKTIESDITSIDSIALGDINGDGALDVFLGALNGNPSYLIAQTKDGVSPLLPFDLTTMADARQALPVFQQKLEQLSSQRGQIGALQSRLSVAMNVLGTTVENSAAAASRILDADIAQETSQLVRTQILQQAGSAVLSQANQQPALALMLLSAR